MDLVVFTNVKSLSYLSIIGKEMDMNTKEKSKTIGHKISIKSSLQNLEWRIE